MPDNPNCPNSEVILVLCPTIFHNAFRSGDYTPFNLEIFKKRQDSRFIANFIIEMGSELPEGEQFAITASTIYNDFRTELEKSHTNSGTYDYLQILENLICRVHVDKENKLSEDERIIVLADILFSRSNREPVIVTETVDKKREVAQKFYDESSGKPSTPIPFTISSPKETKIFLSKRYPQIYIDVENKFKLG